jgi:hypothetical protein
VLILRLVKNPNRLDDPPADDETLLTVVFLRFQE